MHATSIILNILLSVLVLAVVVGGLLWAALSSRGGRAVAVPRPQPTRRHGPAAPGRPSAPRPAARDRGAAAAL